MNPPIINQSVYNKDIIRISLVHLAEVAERDRVVDWFPVFESIEGIMR